MSQTDTLVQTVHMFSGDDCKELGLSMCGVLIMERDMIIEPDKITSSDGQVMKEVGKT